MADEQESGLARTILSLGEERLGELVSQLLANERFVNAMQGAVTSSLSAKRTVDKNVSRLLSLVNVPTLDDVDELREKMGELEDLLGDIQDRIKRIDERVSASREEQKPATPAKPTAKKTTRKKKGA